MASREEKGMSVGSNTKLNGFCLFVSFLHLNFLCFVFNISGPQMSAQDTRACKMLA